MLRWNSAQAGWLFLFAYVTGIILTYTTHRLVSQEKMELGAFALYVLIGQVGLNLLPALLWCKYKNYELRAFFRLHRVPARVIVISLIVYALTHIFMLFVHQATELVSAALGKSYEPSVYPIASDAGSFAVLLVCIGIIPPLCEELLFRGAVLSGYESKGTWFAAVMSALLFALFHDNPFRLAELFLAAFTTSVIALYARSIWPGLAAHLVTNITYVIGSYMQGGDLVGKISSASPGAQSLEPLLYSGLASIPALYAAWLLLRKMKALRPAAEEQIPAGNAAARSNDGKHWIVPIVLAVVVFVVKVAWLK